MSNFWPPRSTPIGFSIEGLAKKYRQKLSKVSYKKSETIEYNEQLNSQIISDKDVIRKDFNSKINSIHWANRDFAEYKEAA